MSYWIRYEARRGLVVHLNRAAYHVVQYLHDNSAIGGVCRILTVRIRAIQMPQGSTAAKVLMLLKPSIFNLIVYWACCSG